MDTDDSMMAFEKQRRLNRLISVYKIWKSKTEMMSEAGSQFRNQAISPATASEGDTCRLEISQLDASNLMQLQQQSRPPTATTATTCQHRLNPPALNDNGLTLLQIPGFVSGGRRLEADTEAEFNVGSESAAHLHETGRLWQSFVVPLVLACIIFLLVIWTRQISLVLVNDTIIMVFILSSIFVLMSAIAFWLAQDQKRLELAAEELADSGLGGLAAEQPQPAQRSFRHHQCRHSHTAHLETYCHHQHRHRHIHRDPILVHNKCCGLALVDCRPPDYYSALENSLPVELGGEPESQDPPSYSEVACGTDKAFNGSLSCSSAHQV